MHLRSRLRPLFAGAGLLFGTALAQAGRGDELPVTELPDLITPSARPAPAAAPAPVVVPRGESGYVPALSYLPDYVPPSPRKTNVVECACEPTGRMWLDVAYVFGTSKPESVPGVIGTGVAAGPSRSPGVVGTLLGRDVGGAEVRSGLRVHGGVWLNRCETVGLEGSLFVLEPEVTSATYRSDGSATLSLPFGTPGGEFGTLPLAAPGLYAGGSVLLKEVDVIGAEANLRENLWCGSPLRIDAIVGYRYLRVAETLQLFGQRTSLADAGGLPAGTRFGFDDAFRAANNFHGGQFGLCGAYRWHGLTVDVAGKVAFGVNNDFLSVSGTRTLSVPGAEPVVAPGGVYTGQGNLGNSVDLDLCVLPEVNCRLGYQFGDHLCAYLGYNFLYLSSVRRPGLQMDLNTPPLPVSATGALGSGFTRRDMSTDFWIQGITLGMELRY